MAAVLAKGTQFQIYSTTYQTILGCTKIEWSGSTSDTEDVTNHDATSTAKQMVTTLHSNGDVNLTITWDNTDPLHALLRTLSQTGAANNFQLIHVNTTETAQFEGYVKSFKYTTATNAVLKAEVAVLVNGVMNLS